MLQWQGWSPSPGPLTSIPTADCSGRIHAPAEKDQWGLSTTPLPS